VQVPNDSIGSPLHWYGDPTEVGNTITHGLGFILAVAGAIAMTICVLREGDAWRVLGCTIYASTLVIMYAMSTLSHYCSGPSTKHIFRMLDQGFIYLLIVATYTPFSLAFLRTTPWWLFLAGMWALAIFGFLSKTFLEHRVDAVSIWIYVVLGWIPIVSASSLIGQVPVTGLWWMLIGGLFYTAGITFLIFDKRIPLFHRIWHLFVMAGSTCHFFVIFVFVASTR
jgi:hemolysin III